MRTRLVAFTAALAVSAVGVSPAIADVSTTQQLPPQSCNSGTMNAHNNIPETTGTGTTTPAHMAVPGTANVTPCGHGG